MGCGCHGRFHAFVRMQWARPVWCEGQCTQRNAWNSPGSSPRGGKRASPEPPRDKGGELREGSLRWGARPVARVAAGVVRAVSHLARPGLEPGRGFGRSRIRASALKKADSLQLGLFGYPCLHFL